MTNLPPEGTILQCMDEESARVDIELMDGQPPFLYGRAFIPMLFGQKTGWYLQPFATEQDCKGIKCILASNARDDIIKKQGIVARPLRVKSLRVLRISKSKNSLICEVAEHWQEAAVIPELQRAA
jgi:hypothetical protein